MCPMSAILYSTTVGRKTKQTVSLGHDTPNEESCSHLREEQMHVPRGISADMLRVTVLESGVALVKKFR